MIIEKKACAKINLYLKILDKLPNGYHSIYTIMQRISLCDDITVNIRDISGGGKSERDIKLSCSDESLANCSNTAYKAADLFLDVLSITNDVSGISVDIDIIKRIPSQAGLGGGSSDAAAVILALNQYFNYPASEKDMIRLAAQIGADVPFFVKNKSRAICRGIGEEITSVRAKLKGLHAVIFKPAYNISTKQAFEDFDRFINYDGCGGLNRLDQLDRLNQYQNDFTALAFSQNKNLEEIREIMLSYGAEQSELTGSGSALFGIFGSLKNAEKCADFLRRRGDMQFCGVFDFA